MLEIKKALPFVVFALFLAGCTKKYDSGPVVSYNSLSRTTSYASYNKNHPTMNPYQINGHWYHPTIVNVGQTFRGVASWYGPNFHGKLTSNGEVYNMYAMTAAHKTFPMNTVLRVTNLSNRKSIVVRINDRGPFVDDRIIDLSKKAATRLGVIKHGTTKVKLEVLGFYESGQRRSQYKKKVKHKVIGNFYVQIGAFSKIEGAKAFKQKHDRQVGKYRTIIKTSKKNGSNFYRIWVKGFKSAEEANNFIQNSTFKHAFVAKD